MSSQADKAVIINELEDQRPEKVFEFGSNWKKYIDNYLDKDAFEEAKESLIKFCGKDAFEGKTFLDIGCGSGLFSLAAFELGAKAVTSIDVDPNSVKCCMEMKERAENPENWTIKQASILDANFVDEFAQEERQHDFVYSWGVLHHTGDMWTAIDNVTKLVKDEGHLYIAIYNKSDGLNIYPDYRFGNSEFWLWEKEFYCSLPNCLQTVFDHIVMSILILAYLITLQNPFRKIREHKSLRGMNWKTDIIDWIGGYPYEFATVQEIFSFVKEKDFSLENLISTNGLLNNEFLFKKKGKSK